MSVRNPLMLSEEKLAELNERYPKGPRIENTPEAHFLEAIKQFSRFEKRELSEDELKLARFIWKSRGEDDYIAVENATAGDKTHVRQSALRAVLHVANRQFFSRSESMKHYRPVGAENLNP